MIWREIKIGVFILSLCTLAALGTVAIYEHTSGTTRSAWLLLPLFALIAVAILGSELAVKKAVLPVSWVTANASAAIVLPIPSALVVATAVVVISSVTLCGTQASIHSPQNSSPPTYPRVAIQSLDLRQNAALR